MARTGLIGVAVFAAIAAPALLMVAHGSYIQIGDHKGFYDHDGEFQIISPTVMWE